MPNTQRKACLSCRLRKLKCDKQQPCANCTTRSVECKEQLLAPVSRGVKQTLDESESSTIPRILSRLDRLEAYISIQQNNYNEGVSMDTFAKEVNTVRNSISEANCGSRADTSIAGKDRLTASKANASTARNAQSDDADFGVSLAQLSANDNILVCLESITMTLPRY